MFDQVHKFLVKASLSSDPFLLALSGGADSLFLFYALLKARKKEGILFHVAHVDHGWRAESGSEEEALCALCLHHKVPFHSKKLDPNDLKGNVEAACRDERYAFFSDLCRKTHCQAVLTGHHLDDQAETVFKRILEGAHWSCWQSLKEESLMGDLRILRPLLQISKKEIQRTLSEEGAQPFEDPTNKHLQFLRARLRETIFPWLNREFGKEVQPSFIAAGKDALELTEYFNKRLQPILELIVEDANGCLLDLRKVMPESLLEIKYLLRLFSKRYGFFLSRTIIEQAAIALQSGRTNKVFVMRMHRMAVDRGRIFLTDLKFTFPSCARILPMIE